MAYTSWASVQIELLSNIMPIVDSLVADDISKFKRFLRI